MSIYLDTSVLIAALTPEPGTDSAQRAIEKAIDPTVSHWTLTEASSALAMKVRLGAIDLIERGNVLAQIHRSVIDSFTLVSIGEDSFRLAASFADRHETALRGGDALHLAIAANHGLTLWTLDRRLANAGPVLGVPTLLL